MSITSKEDIIGDEKQVSIHFRKQKQDLHKPRSMLFVE